MLKLSYIKRLPNGKWQVTSKSGKNLGTYTSKSKAEERLKQVEMFKHMDKQKRKRAFYIISENISKSECTKTLSSVLRDVNKKDPDQVKTMIGSFKDAFDEAVISELENPDNIALMHILKKSD